MEKSDFFPKSQFQVKVKEVIPVFYNYKLFTVSMRKISKKPLLSLPGIGIGTVIFRTDYHRHRHTWNDLFKYSNSLSQCVPASTGHRLLVIVSP